MNPAELSDHLAFLDRTKQRLSQVAVFLADEKSAALRDAGRNVASAIDRINLACEEIGKEMPREEMQCTTR